MVMVLEDCGVRKEAFIGLQEASKAEIYLGGFFDEFQIFAQESQPRQQIPFILHTRTASLAWA